MSKMKEHTQEEQLIFNDWLEYGYGYGYTDFAFLSKSKLFKLIMYEAY